MRVLYSGYIDPKHSQNGGYDKITHINLDKRILLSNNYLGGKSPINSSFSRIPFYLLDIHTRFLRYKYDITHLFYGELTMLPLLPYFKNRSHKTIITLHLKVEDHKMLSCYLSQLKKFDGIIVLSSNQRKLLKEKYGLESVFIPHGFSKPHFKNSLIKDINFNQFDEKKINISLIGSNYRDFETLKRIIESPLVNRSIQFHLVGVPSEIKEYLKDKANVSLYSRLSDDEYYSLLSNVDYNFLPLTFATANNTLLEAQYLGTPSILPEISGVLDYAAPEPYNLFYNHIDELINILNNVSKGEKNKYLVKYAEEHFDWKVVYSQLRQYYESIFRETPKI